MPPSPLELQAWWLTTGRKSLERLFSRHDLVLEPHQVGFPQAVQHKLRTFDHDETWQASLRADWQNQRAKQTNSNDFNPRRRLKEALTTIFRRAEAGGLLFENALEGLGRLDSAEVHRLRLIAAVNLALDSAISQGDQMRVFEELQSATSNHYLQFHMGFRACVSI